MLRTDDESCGLENIAFLFVPAAQRFSGGGAGHSVKDGESQFKFVYRSLRFVERIGGDGVERNVLRGECVEVSLKVS